MASGKRHSIGPQPWAEVFNKVRGTYANTRTQDNEDVDQDILEKFVVDQDILKKATPAYIRECKKNKTIDLNRKRKHERLCDDLDDQPLPVATDTDHAFEWMLESLRHLLEELPEELQNTWRLWLGGPRGQRIADILSEEILKDSNKQYNIYLLIYLLRALSTFTEKLPPKYRLLWKLWLHGEDAGEISKKLDIPIETVRTRLKRIEKALEAHIQALRTT